MGTTEGLPPFVFTVVRFLKHEPHTDLSAPGIRAVRKSLRGIAFAHSRRGSQHHAVRRACVVLLGVYKGVGNGIEDIECLKVQIDLEALSERKFLRQPGVDAKYLVDVEIVER